MAQAKISSSKVKFVNALPELGKISPESLVIFDQQLLKISPKFKKWIKSATVSYGVTAGEGLKDVYSFPEHIQNIVALTQTTSVINLTVVVVGGGSVGDFGAFVASILKRGVRLVMIPSTWLAAIDSSHGGKTALNVGGMKNQIGTFYPATEIYLCRDLLFSQNSARVFEGFGEMLKIALLAGGSFWQKFGREKEMSQSLLWKYLPQAVKAKNTVVSKDPEEKSGYRHILNLGHTMGHALESLHDLPHGVAINYGINFSLRWSLRKKIMNATTQRDLEKTHIAGYFLSATRDHLLSSRVDFLKTLKNQLLGDKKKTHNQRLRFIFLQKPGKPIVREVSVDEILIEVCSQLEDEHA